MAALAYASSCHTIGDMEETAEEFIIGCLAAEANEAVLNVVSLVKRINGRCRMP
ncbi:hypothetical protein SI65_01484 [Aspergillus cristatus]|uniref:Uncharacterized protein n=1 Tax=Aspergillus cristatus TaxID=573508 RepID=A0A1E3BSF1_ASPCR|nr:hypothetical protein SI65_01484 [Aspergillus cristatus]